MLILYKNYRLTEFINILKISLKMFIYGYIN